MTQRLTIQDILTRKNQEKIICLTAYTFPMAKILDHHCDIILVGDSLGMTIYGFNDTVDVTLDMMINHGKAVMKAVKKSLVIVDLPFGTYESSPEQALQSAQKVIHETGCDAIKIETTSAMGGTVKHLVDNGIAVAGHIGLLPQSVRKIGGYKYQGRSEEEAQEILQTAKIIEKAGAFCMIIEAVPEKLAHTITNAITIPTIGIGASGSCDGQVLVTDDLLGLNQEFKPKFVTHYANLAQDISQSLQSFSKDVKNGLFPKPNNLL